jgi:hypothetical protein
LGPLAVTGFYSLICFVYLANPPTNDIAPHRVPDARYVFYVWIVMSAFVLDWSRVGLANLEAAALMHPSLAPNSAMELMWHADSNWFNFLWWLRAIRNLVLHLWLSIGSLSGPRRQYATLKPDKLWCYLSFTSFLLFISIPLSSLTMEPKDAFVPSSERALVLGPGPSTFNLGSLYNLPQQIRNEWRSGRPTTPKGKALLYAPAKTKNVSTTYYDDIINSVNRNNSIQIFAGPVVNELVSGNAWGLQSNITCQAVPKEDLKLISVLGFDDYALLDFMNSTDPHFKPSSTFHFSMTPSWVNETGIYHNAALYSLIAAADGAHYGSSPYTLPDNRDVYTLDYATGHTTEVSIGLLEIFLWQGPIRERDDTMDDLLKSTSKIIAINSTSRGGIEKPIPIAGFGVQCSVESAVGNATLDPAHRTYSGFRNGTSSVGNGGDSDVWGVQMCALQSLGVLEGYSFGPRNAKTDDSTWLALHQALGIAPYSSPNASTYLGEMTHRALRPEDLQKGMLKLLGAAVVTSMDQGWQDSWFGNLYGLKKVKYLEPFVFPWKGALGLLVVWTLLTVPASVWMLFTRRWAPTLDGFEMFKFGARHVKEVNQFQGTQFGECESLRTIPGMVGIASGVAPASSYGLIGLSERRANPNTCYTFDAMEAAPARD